MRDGNGTDITLMLQAIDFVETHLQNEITVADIAGSVSFSLFHFSRVFSRVSGYTPYDYLMRRRLSEATRRLLATDEKIIDIAVDYQFKAAETFSRAFKRVNHVPPRQARQMGVDGRYLTLRLERDYLLYLNSGVSLKPVPVTLPAQDVAGIVGQIGSADDRYEISRLWAQLGQALSSSDALMVERKLMGLMIYPPAPGGRAMYLAGIVLEDGEQVPASFVQKSIPAAHGALFDIESMPQAAQFSRRYINQNWWHKATAGPLPQVEIECYGSLPSDPLNGGPGKEVVQLLYPMSAS